MRYHTRELRKYSSKLLPNFNGCKLNKQCKVEKKMIVSGLVIYIYLGILYLAAMLDIHDSIRRCVSDNNIQKI